MNKTIHSSEFRKKPIWFSAINRFWKNSYGLGTEIKISKDVIIRSARRQCGLFDLGNDFWDEPLDRLIESVNEEANLHPIGRFITRKRLENLLCVRLRAEDCFKKHPEILEQSLYPVTVIIGLQRTGTTKLQRLLSSDPAVRPLYSWEALNPAPIKGDAHSGSERKKIAKMSERALKYMSPGFFAIHPVEHLAPEEDILLLDVSFLSTTAEATMHVPAYASWLESIDQSPAYTYSAKLLRLLQWQRPGQRWILKSPHHLEFANELHKQYEDVQFIWTHRKIEESIPSFLSMVAYARSLFSDTVDLYEVSKHWIRKTGFMLKKALAFRNTEDHNQLFVDVGFYDLLNHTEDVLANIYSHRGEQINDSLQNVFRTNEKNNPRGKYGKHAYQLSDFGVSENLLHEHTAAYQNAYRHLL